MRPSRAVFAVMIALTALAAVTGAASGAFAAQARWRIAREVHLRGTSILDSAVAVSQRQAWAIGRKFPVRAPAKAVVLRLDQKGWRPVRLPKAYRDDIPTAIAGSSSSNVWLFGFDGILRWTGRRWLAVSFPGSFAALAEPTAVTTGPDNTWLFGDHVWHYNGHHWRRTRPYFSVFGASAVSASDIWAVGDDPHENVLAHWDGHTWTRVPLPPAYRHSYAAFFNILALPDGDVWLTGSSGYSGGGPLALRYRHGVWHSYQGGGADALGQAIPDGSGGIWAAYFGADDLTTLVHIHAGHWDQVKVPKVRGKHASVTALVRMPGSGRTFAFGSLYWSSRTTRTEGLILRYG